MTAVPSKPWLEDVQLHPNTEWGASCTNRSGQWSVVEEQFDLVVLSVGMEISESVRALGKRLGVELDEYPLHFHFYLLAAILPAPP